MALAAATNFSIYMGIVQFIDGRRFNLDIFSPSRHSIFAFVVQVLLNLLQVKYQGKDKSPFETHPKTMLAAIACLLVYCYARLKIPPPPPHHHYHHQHPSSSSRSYYTSFLSTTIIFSGPLFLASILSVLLSESLFRGPLLYSLSILFSLCELLSSQIRTVLDWVARAASNIMEKWYGHQPHQQGTRGIRRGLVSVQLPWVAQQALHRPSI